VNEKYCYALAGGSVLVSALWIGFGGLHEHQNADSIVPVLVSLQKWTPFYWEADRVGMLVPLLAMPFRNPLRNLIVQTVLDTTGVLAASFLLARYVLGPSPTTMAAAALSNIWWFLLTPRLIQFHWLVVQATYGLSITLGVLALLTRRRALAIVLIALAHWVNVTVFLVLVPLVALRNLAHRDRRELPRSIILIVIGSVSGWLLMMSASYRATVLGFDPVTLWLPAWGQLARQAQHFLFPNAWILLWLLIPAPGALLFARQHVVVSVGLLVSAIGYWLLVGTMAWVRINHYSPGYLVPAFVLISLAFATLAVAPFERYGRQLWVAMATAMVASAAWTSGWPSVTTVRQALDRHGKSTPAIIDSHATVISGNYWMMWPAVFHANLVAYERGLNRQFYGDGERGRVTRSLWPETYLTYDIP